MRALALLTALFVLNSAAADEPTPGQAEFFVKKVRPILEASCFKCHSHAAKKSKGDLVVDSRVSLLKGGESGPAVVVGQPEVSLFVKAIRYQHDELRMPPSGKLPDDQIATLIEWIKLGAPWPGETPKSIPHVPGKITDADREWWAFQPLKPIAPPKVDDPAWNVHPIDRFIGSRLQAEGLKPSTPASRETLIRRLSFDLIGLPPTPSEIDAFVKDQDPNAYERLVDRLLASPRYGEKWARHWLDLVRYAESDGYRLDEYRPTAWMYRDYVIRSFNADKPYDRFVQEQLAGDELFPEDGDALTATAYLRHWIYEYNQRDVRVQWQDILDDVTSVTAETFLGLGMACARCHDHKFDPILQKDFFRLQAFFAGIQPNDYEILASADDRATYHRKLEAWQAMARPILDKVDALSKKEKAAAERSAIKKFQPDIQEILNRPFAGRTPFEKQLAALAYRQVTYELDKIDKKLAQTKPMLELEAELVKFDAFKPTPLPRGFAVRDVGPEAPPIAIPKKKRGESIAPGFPTVLDAKPAEISAFSNSTGRRTALARWLTRPDHPLTSRVLVNRIWQEHFGAGLVTTPSDFGRLGERPSHPELLDWLAQNFVSGGWSIKALHRKIVTSMTYRQSATQPAADAAVKKDPENRLLWRMTTRRLQAEQIRDAILAVNGRLELKDGGPSVAAAEPRRTIYTKIFRNTRDPLLDVFDAPEGVTSTGQRNVTTTPTQALLMINSPFMVAQAKALLSRLEKEANGDEAKIAVAFRYAFGRRPTANEVQQTLSFLREQGQAAAWVDFCQVLLNANEFLYVD